MVTSAANKAAIYLLVHTRNYIQLVGTKKKNQLRKLAKYYVFAANFKRHYQSENVISYNLNVTSSQTRAVILATSCHEKKHLEA